MRSPAGIALAAIVTAATVSATMSLAGLATRRRSFALGGFVSALVVQTVGLISTVVLLTHAFQSLGGVPASEKSARLSALIAEAMQPTWWALLAAAPCLGLGIAALVVASRRSATPRSEFGVHPPP
ncbi:MAG: MotA/TolQ/ExbB proton channel family protein [Myxococcaceae bacterium]|nr:MotA/TolQ/ExbB proton channel family protein [Myxococcaceae bacterium]